MIFIYFVASVRKLGSTSDSLYSSVWVTLCSVQANAHRRREAIFEFLWYKLRTFQNTYIHMIYIPVRPAVSCSIKVERLQNHNTGTDHRYYITFFGNTTCLFRYRYFLLKHRSHFAALCGSTEMDANNADQLCILSD